MMFLHARPLFKTLWLLRCSSMSNWLLQILVNSKCKCKYCFAPTTFIFLHRHSSTSIDYSERVQNRLHEVLIILDLENVLNRLIHPLSSCFSICGYQSESLVFSPSIHQLNCSKMEVQYFRADLEHHGKRKRLSNAQRHAIAERLCLLSDNGRLKQGSIIETATRFSTSTRTVERIWKQSKSCIQLGIELQVSNVCHGNKGIKRVGMDLSGIKGLNLSDRTNVRSVAAALDLPKTTVHRRIKEGLIIPHTNAIKPFLSEKNKKDRLRFRLSMIEADTMNTNPTFVGMFNFVHIDEKLFYMSKTTQRYYLHPDEVEPHRTCKSKRFIPKVMFLAAVARPRIDLNYEGLFHGKLGMIPIVSTEPAKRNSKNRAAGTWETKPILSVTREVSRALMIEKVLPALRAKWPTVNSETIIIQQDNAPSHITVDDEEFCKAAQKLGLDVHLVCQPPNSPDLNVLDLVYFRAIQSLHYKEAPKTVDELISAVEKSFDDLTSTSLNDVFLTLQSCMIEVIKVLGGNNYKTPHLQKKKLRQNSCLPTRLTVDVDIVQRAISYLEQ